jgi:hypothetical protein
VDINYVKFLPVFRQFGSQPEPKRYSFETPICLTVSQDVGSEQARHLMAASAETLDHIVHNVGASALTLVRNGRGDQNSHCPRLFRPITK